MLNENRRLIQKRRHAIITNGELAEWSNAAVLKTVVPQGTRGSNPLLSATNHPVINVKPNIIKKHILPHN